MITVKAWCKALTPRRGLTSKKALSLFPQFPNLRLFYHPNINSNWPFYKSSCDSMKSKISNKSILLLNSNRRTSGNKSSFFLLSKCVISWVSIMGKSLNSTNLQMIWKNKPNFHGIIWKILLHTLLTLLLQLAPID